MNVTFNGKLRKVRFVKGMKVGDVIRELNLQRERVLVKVNGRFSSDLEVLKECDKVDIIQVVYGG